MPIVFLRGQMRDDTLPDDLQRLPWIEKSVRFEQLLGALDQAANEKIHEQRVSRMAAEESPARLLIRH